MSEADFHPISTITGHKPVTEPMKMDMFFRQSRVSSDLLLQKRLQIGRILFVHTVRYRE